MTEARSELAAALAELQAKMPDIPHNQTADAGAYTYTYADLKSATEILYPLMGPLGLSFTAKGVVLPDGRYVLRCSLLHISGEREDADYPLKPDQRHQDIGSAISYGRRYMFCALTGAVTEKDDDAQRADGVVAKRIKRSKGKPDEPDQWASPPPPEIDSAPPKLTVGQLQAIQAGFKELGVTDRQARLRIINSILGLEPPDAIETSSVLDRRQAAAVLDAINQKKAEQQGGNKKKQDDIVIGVDDDGLFAEGPDSEGGRMKVHRD